MNPDSHTVPQPRRPEEGPLEGRAERADSVQPEESVQPAEPVQRIVVGVDGSPASVQALVWALREAGELGCAVDVVTAWPVRAPVFVREAPGHFSEARWTAAQAQARAIAHALSLLDEAPAYSRRLENAGVVDALVEAAQPGDLLVLGTDRTDDADLAPQQPVAGVPLTVHLENVADCPVVLITSRGVRGPGSAGEANPARTQRLQAQSRTSGRSSP